MTESIGDLLAKKDLSEPDEVKVIKLFLQQHYRATCLVAMGPRQIVITVRGASLAGAIRMRLHELQVLCQTEKRLTIRILG